MFLFLLLFCCLSSFPTHWGLQLPQFLSCFLALLGTFSCFSLSSSSGLRLSNSLNCLCCQFFMLSSLSFSFLFSCQALSQQEKFFLHFAPFHLYSWLYWVFLYLWNRSVFLLSKNSCFSLSQGHSFIRVITIYDLHCSFLTAASLSRFSLGSLLLSLF